MNNQVDLSSIQKNTVIGGILAVSLAGWYFLFAMDNNMSNMNMGMDMKPKSEMKMDMKPKSEMKMDMKMDMPSETWLPNTYWMPPMDNNWSSNDFYQLFF